MKNYFIKCGTMNSHNPIIIDEETLIQAEQGNNYFNPDDFTFAYEAQNMEEALYKHRQELAMERYERMHPQHG